MRSKTNSFGETFEKFLEILSMPDRYIIYRSHYQNDGALDWQKEYHSLNADQRTQLLDILAEFNAVPRKRPERVARIDRSLRPMIEHHYSGGQTAPKTPEGKELAQQGVSVGYDSGIG